MLTHEAAVAPVFANVRTYHQAACACGWVEEGRAYETSREALRASRAHVREAERAEAAT